MCLLIKPLTWNEAYLLYSHFIQEEFSENLKICHYYYSKMLRKGPHEKTKRKRKVKKFLKDASDFKNIIPCGLKFNSKFPKSGQMKLL